MRWSTAWGIPAQKPEIFPGHPHTRIHRLRIPQYGLTILFGFDDTTVELLEIEDGETYA